jgi:hypothetical protein
MNNDDTNSYMEKVNSPGVTSLGMTKFSTVTNPDEVDLKLKLIKTKVEPPIQHKRMKSAIS